MKKIQSSTHNFFYVFVSSTLYIILKILMYNCYMRLRKPFCLVFFSIFTVLSLAAQTDTLAEDKPFSETLTEDFQKINVWNFVGNEDNSLFLMHVTDEEEYLDTIYYFQNGLFMRDVRIHKLWDSGPGVGNIVFSPYSKKFYFCSAWGASPGLWTASQTAIKDFPLKLDHVSMSDNRGYLAVNKTGVWLLHDEAFLRNGSKSIKGMLYKVEDSKGTFILKIPSSLKQTSFNSFYNFMNEKRDYSTEVKEHEQCLKYTDYTLLICDEDESTWWVFNCITEKMNKYDSLEIE